MVTPLERASSEVPAMLDLLSSLSIRGYLKQARKNQTVIGLVTQGYEAFPCRVKKVNWFTVEVDVLSDDEETFLATQVHSIHQIQYVDLQNVVRFKIKLMAQSLNGQQIEREEVILDEDDEC